MYVDKRTLHGVSLEFMANLEYIAITTAALVWFDLGHLLQTESNWDYGMHN